MDVVIYHDDCLDGFCAAWVAHHALPDARFIPAKYGDLLPNVTLGDEVYILDFSYPREKLLLLSKQCARVVVLDHHKTAQKDLSELEATNLFITFNLEKSGARLAYDFFAWDDDITNSRCWSNEPAEWLINAVQDRDLWQFKLAGTEEINLALGALPRTFTDWTRLSYSKSDAILNGKVIKFYRDQLVQQILKDKVRWVEISGHMVPIVNTPMLQSEVCHELLKVYQSAPFVATYYTNEKTEHCYSLRSDDKRIDVSVIAGSHGGGGHRNAAGFTVRREFVALAEPKPNYTLLCTGTLVHSEFNSCPVHDR